MRKPKYTIEYTNEGLDEWQGAKCSYPWFPLFGTCKIIVKPKYKESNDIGIVNHEIKHAEQYANNLLHSFKYAFSKKYRYKCELEAYTEQINTYGYTNITEANWIVNSLYSKYSLGLSKYKIMLSIIGIIKRITSGARK